MVDYLDRDFDNLVEQLLTSLHVPGLSIAVVDNGRISAKGYGLARFPDIAATPKTLYYTGSTTKAMTAATLGIAIHDPSRVKNQPKDGMPLSWRTPVKAVCEEFSLQDNCASQNTTIEDALSHRSGMSGDDTFYGPWMGAQPSDITRSAKYLGPLTKPFRTGMQYNNWMVAIAGDVLEHVSGMKHHEAIKKWLWDPIGMSRSSWHLKEIFENKEISVMEDMSRGYFWVEPNGYSDEAEGYYIPEKFLDLAGIAPAGATISSVLDFARWMQILLDAGSGLETPDTEEIEAQDENQAKPVLSEELFRELTTPRSMVDMDMLRALPNSQMTPLLAALGWMLPSTTLGPLHPVITHGGGLNGYGTELLILPNDKFGVVTMGNTALTSNLLGVVLTSQLIARRMGLKQSGKEKRLSDFLASVVQELSSDSAIFSGLLLDLLQSVDPVPLNNVTLNNVQLNLNAFIPIPESAHLRRYEGVYRNKSHGEFRVMLVPVPLDCDDAGENIQRRKLVYKSTDLAHRKVKEQIRSLTLALQVDPMHERTWKWSFVLRPRKSTGGSGTIQDFDQELFRGFGMFEGDVTEGVPTGVENNSPDDRCRDGNVWQGVSWSELGAAIIKNTLAGEPHYKLGLTTANQLFMAPTTREKDWHSKMTWFEKIRDF